jgi:hypothetical protein
VTSELRQARTCSAAATLVITASAYAAGSTGNAWLLLPGLYVGTVLAWCAARLRAAHHRVLTVHARARRRALADRQAPPTACCTVADRPDSPVHSRECARDRTSEVFGEIVARLNDPSEPQQ